MMDQMFVVQVGLLGAAGENVKWYSQESSWNLKHHLAISSTWSYSSFYADIQYYS